MDYNDGIQSTASSKPQTNYSTTCTASSKPQTNYGTTCTASKPQTKYIGLSSPSQVRHFIV